ncbi:MAG: tetratricopeptide repeat protein [Pseudomonadota bacterium]
MLISMLFPGLLQSAPLEFDVLEYHYGMGSGLQSNPNAKLTSALQTAQAGDLAGAIKQLNAFLESNPQSASGHELLGMITAFSGDLEQGLTYLQKAITINPEQATAYTKIGDIHQAAGREKAAISAFRQALQTRTGDRRAHQRLGLIAEAAGDTEAAIKHLEQGLIGTAPSYLGIKVNLARLYNAQARFADTRKLLGNAILGDNVSAFVLLAAAELNDGNSQSALDTLAQARKLDPAHAGAWLATGITLRTAGRPAEAVDALKRSLEINPDWGIAHYQLGESYSALKQLQPALVAYEAARADSATRTAAALRVAETLVKLDRQDAAIDAYAALWEAGALNTLQAETYGALLERSGNLEAAQQLYADWGQRSPNARAIAHSARLNAARGRYTEASKQLERAVQDFPEATALKVLLGTVQQRSREYGAAATTLRQALAQEDDPETRFLLATVLDESEQPAAAEREYERILKADPEHVGALNNLAVLLMDLEQIGRAVELARQAARLAPENVFVADTFGWALYQSGDIASARGILERAARSPVNYAPLHYHLAELYSGSEPKRALEHVNKALAISSRFDEADSARQLKARLLSKG